jgi:hypothetical protein
LNAGLLTVYALIVASVFLQVGCVFYAWRMRRLSSVPGFRFPFMTTGFALMAVNHLGAFLDVTMAPSNTIRVVILPFVMSLFLFVGLYYRCRNLAATMERIRQQAAVRDGAG